MLTMTLYDGWDEELLKEGKKLKEVREARKRIKEIRNLIVKADSYTVVPKGICYVIK